MSFFTKKKIIITHDGSFHTDDVFAVIALSILNKGNVRVIRTRDPKKIKKGDYVCDVGEIYDPDKDLFDHHQKGGAGTHPNGIPYSSFGLIWKKYGEQICGNKKVADKIDQKIVQPIDAFDNGVDIVEKKDEIKPYTVDDMISSYHPSLKEEQNYYESFLRAVAFFEDVFEREIIKTRDLVQSISSIKKSYEEAKDKRIIILNKQYSWHDVITEYEEPLYVIVPRVDGTWKAECVRKDKYYFENRKSLPETWAGKRDKELANTTGVPDSIFCHRERFMVVAKSKEGAIKLAEKAVIV